MRNTNMAKMAEGESVFLEWPDMCFADCYNHHDLPLRVASAILSNCLAKCIKAAKIDPNRASLVLNLEGKHLLQHISQPHGVL